MPSPTANGPVAWYAVDRTHDRANPLKYGLCSRMQPNCASNNAMAILDRFPRITEHTKLLATRVRPFLNRKYCHWTLIVIGIVLLGYVGGEYWKMYRSQKNLEAEWQRQAATVKLPGHADISPSKCSPAL